MERDYATLGAQTAAGRDIDVGQAERARGYQEEGLQSMLALAAGGESEALRLQRERGQQGARAAAASVRGAPAAAVQRMMTQQMAEVDRGIAEAIAGQQTAAAQQVNQFAAQMRNQDMSLEQMQTQFANELGLSNAQMQNEVAQAEAQINAQLEAQRDSMVDSLIGRGVDRNVALMQVSAELDMQRRELTYRYWAGRLGSVTEVMSQAIESADFWEGGVEGVAEMAPVISMFTGYGTPEEYAGPTTRVIAGADDPSTFYTETTAEGAPDPSQYEWNFETQSWQLTEGDPGSMEFMGVVDHAGSRMNLYRSWNEDQQRWDYSFQPAGGTDEAGGRWDASGSEVMPSGIEGKTNVMPIGRDEFMRQRTKGMKEGMMGTTGMMRKPEFGMAPSLTKPTALPGQSKLGKINQGLKPSQAPAMMSDRSLNTAEPVPGLKYGASDWRDTALTGMQVGKEVLGVIDAGKGLFTAKGKKQQKEALAGIGAYATSRALNEGFSSLEDYLSETSADAIETSAADYAQDAIKALSQTEAPAVAADVAAQSADLASEAVSLTPGIGPAISTGSKLAQGKGVGRAAVETGGGIIGGAIGTLLGGPGFGTAAGAMAGQVGASKAMDAFDKSATVGGGSAAYTAPQRYVIEGDSYSGLETKSHVEGLHIGSGYGEYVGSDDNMKTGEGPSQDAISGFLRELEPVKYDYKPEYGGEKNQYGIIAQDAEKSPVGRSFVKQDQNGSRMIDTGKATMVNMASAANQQKILDSQGMLIADLLQRIGRLEGRG
jgi:hypothetical protein